jgi:hypothetical protein
MTNYWEIALTWDNKTPNKPCKYMTMYHSVFVDGEEPEIDVEAKLQEMIDSLKIAKALSRCLGEVVIKSDDHNLLEDKLLELSGTHSGADFTLLRLDLK